MTDFFTQEDADSVFEELKGLEVELDGDPIAFGPKRLNTKISQVRNMLTRCERVYLDISQKLHLYRRNLKIMKLEFDLAKNQLLTNDISVRAGKSVSDREATCSVLLADHIKEMGDLEISVESLEAVLAIIKSKKIDLKDVETRLKDQIKLIQEELGLNSKWGTQDQNGMPVSNSMDILFKEMDQTMDEMSSAPVMGAGPSDDELDSILSAIDT